MVFSYPFLSALKAGIMLESMMVTCGRLGEVFWLEALVPLAAVEAPAVPKGVPGTFPAREIPPSALKKRGRPEGKAMRPKKKVKMEVEKDEEPEEGEKQPLVETGMIQVASAPCQE